MLPEIGYVGKNSKFIFMGELLTGKNIVVMGVTNERSLPCDDYCSTMFKKAM